MGDADAVKATALGVKNLQRVTKMLMTATAWKDGETYDDLSEMYGRVISQWQLEMNHVTQIVGGFNSQEKADRPGRPHLQPGGEAAPGGGREIPGGQRLHAADVAGGRGNSAAHRGGRRARPDSQRAAVGAHTA